MSNNIPNICITYIRNGFFHFFTATFRKCVNFFDIFPKFYASNLNISVIYEAISMKLILEYKSTTRLRYKKIQDARLILANFGVNSACPLIPSVNEEISS